jgi:hypothetical protein
MKEVTLGKHHLGIAIQPSRYRRFWYAVGKPRWLGENDYQFSIGLYFINFLYANFSWPYITNK